MGSMLGKFLALNSSLLVAVAVLIAACLFCYAMGIRRLLVLNRVILGLFGIFWIFAMLGVFYRPMGLLFEFKIINATGETIEVTPVGTIGAGYRSRLPMYSSLSPPYLPARQEARFRMAPGEALTVVYDWDDINFSEILVKGSDGIMREVVVDPNPEERQYHSPAADRFILKDLGGLPVARAKVLEVLKDKGNMGLALRQFLFLALITAGLICGKIWLSSRVRKLPAGG